MGIFNVQVSPTAYASETVVSRAILYVDTLWRCTRGLAYCADVQNLQQQLGCMSCCAAGNIVKLLQEVLQTQA